MLRSVFGKSLIVLIPAVMFMKITVEIALPKTDASISSAITNWLASQHENFIEDSRAYEKTVPQSSGKESTAKKVSDASTIVLEQYGTDEAYQNKFAPYEPDYSPYDKSNNDASTAHNSSYRDGLCEYHEWLEPSPYTVDGCVKTEWYSGPLN